MLKTAIRYTVTYVPDGINPQAQAWDGITLERVNRLRKTLGPGVIRIYRQPGMVHFCTERIY